jgi:hypothetical protein
MSQRSTVRSPLLRTTSDLTYCYGCFEATISASPSSIIQRKQVGGYVNWRDRRLVVHTFWRSTVSNVVNTLSVSPTTTTTYTPRLNRWMSYKFLRCRYRWSHDWCYRRWNSLSVCCFTHCNYFSLTESDNRKQQCYGYVNWRAVIGHILSNGSTVSIP